MRVDEIKKLEGIDINRMNDEELKEYVKNATRFTKRRLSNLSNKYTPSKKQLERKIDNKNLPNEKEIDQMTHNDLKHLLKIERDFLNSQTSTIEGEKQRIRNFIRLSIDEQGKSERQIQNLITRRINKLGGYWNLGKIFELIDQIEELEPSLVYELGSGTTEERGFIGTIIETYSSEDFQDLINDPVKFTEKLKNILDEKKKNREDIPF